MKSLSAALLPFLVLGFVAAGRPGPVTTPDHNFTAVSTRIVPSAQTAEGKVVQTCRTSLVIPSYESVPPTSGDRASAGRWMHRSGIRFTENRGQIADTDGRVRTDIAFVADAPGARLFCRNNGISYIFTDSHRRTSTASRDAETAMSADAASVQDAGSCRLDMILDGSNPRVRIRAEEPLPGYANYYLPHCSDGITGVREFGRIVYENVYDNVDFELFSVNGRMKYNFVVRPGGCVSDIRMRYKGADNLALTNEGALSVAAPLGSIAEAVPYTYAGDDQKEIASRFVKRGSTVSFEVAAYDSHETLVIDPWATYYGGSADEYVYGIVTDANGNVYVTGGTSSVDFPVSGGYQMTSGGSTDAFFVKFDANGTRLWATYYGGSGADLARGIAKNGSGNIIITGQTGSSNFPVTAGAWQTSLAGDVDAFVAAFDGSGSRVWASYYGGTAWDQAWALAVDGADNIVFTGKTESTNFPITPGAFQTSKAKSSDAFVVKMNSGGSRLWATYYGGKSADDATGIAVDSYGEICLTGSTSSTNFPVTSGAYQQSSGGSADAFLVKLDAAGGRLWATYLGGNSYDWGKGVCVDGNGDIVVTFTTWSTNIPTSPGAFQPSHAPTTGGHGDAFIIKFSSVGSRLWATYYGGSGADAAESITTDANGNVIIGGYTSGTDFPVSTGAFQTVYQGITDATMIKLDGNGNRLWATYFGGSGQDEGYAVAAAASGDVLLGGLTLSADLPTSNPYQASFAGVADAFIVQLDPNGLLPGYNVPPVAVASATPMQGTAPLTVAFSSAGSYDPDGSITVYSWDFGDASLPSSMANPTHVYQNAGSYTAMLTVTDNNSATASASVQISVSSTGAYVFVFDQTVTRVRSGNKWKGRDVVTIYNDVDQPVADAQVTASYSGPNTGTVTGTTLANGTVTLETALKPNPSGTWCFIVTYVQATGYAFNSSTGELYACETTPKVEAHGLPATLILEQNYPNPFNPSTVITYGIPERGSVRMTILDIHGRAVREVENGVQDAGMHSVAFDGTGLQSGVYLCRLEANGQILTRTMALLK